MTDFDVFNGDADGLCALVQLRNAEPRDARLITGVKRDISLLSRVQSAAGDRVTVLDISLDKNREDLQRILDAGTQVFYCDHHFAGDIPESENLYALINPAPDVCTSILVNGYLEGAYAEWAVVGAYGDNLKDSAEAVARPLKLAADQLSELEALGTYLNYNGYGAVLEELHFQPDELYLKLAGHSSPFQFIAEQADTFGHLRGGYEADMAAAAALVPESASAGSAVYLLPCAPWARRVSGVFSNDLANGTPARAHAVVTEKANGNFLVSVRAPLENKTGADELCRRFPTGGGRQAAAGINDLPAGQLSEFVDAFKSHYG